MEIGKKAKDLLLKGFSTGHMLFFSHVTSTGATLSTTSIMTEGLMLGTVSSSFKSGGVKTDLSLSSLNQATAETTYEDLAPGLKFTLSTTIPGAIGLGKAELVYQPEAASITAVIRGFKTNPILDCSANFGSAKICAGGSVSYDTANNVLLSTLGGIGYTEYPFSLGLLCNPRGDKHVSVFCAHDINPNFSWALHVDYHHETKIRESTIGGSYMLDPQTSFKAKLNDAGLLSAVLEYEPKPLVTVGLCAEVNCRSLNKEKPSVGLTVTVLSI